MSRQHVVLVTEADETTGTMEKLEVHQQGLLHRAFSVFIFDSKGRMLLQQRAADKYHGAGLWSNTCCSHPYPGEKVDKAAHRRLQEEMGFDTDLQKVFEFMYKAPVENDLIEHEYDHVFVGEYNGKINFNKKEVADCCYEDMDNIKWALEKQPLKFTKWFHIAFPRVEAWWQERYGS